MTMFWVVVLACLAVQASSEGCDSEKEFECTNGFCIDKSRRCNGIFECLDFSDEDNCLGSKCQPGEFLCTSGECISGELRCNGSPDCPDESDEDGCVKILCHGHSFIYNAVTKTCMSCQHNTQGRNCEKCKPGFYGNAEVGTMEDCKQCECNGHSMDCDITGKCENCGHNTEGEKCESCRPGFRGDATKGTAGDCAPNSPDGTDEKDADGKDADGKDADGKDADGKPKTCDCNGHSTECDSAGKCKDCKDNTEGNMCEKCKTGYTGDPTKGTPNDCKPNQCRCNKHSDTCPDGVCQDCQHHTTGVYCETCEPGYYGKATGQTPNDCKKCPCSPRSIMCIEVPGETQPKCMGCEDGYLGEKCDKCDGENGFEALQGGPTAPNGCCVRRGVTDCPSG
ncbi:laminin subunit gamma-1-like isoform X2 [Branchiostoma lanceolatum]|uniref:laminin subunit gamma-1-like isoform X2 n=1 Tax=Branchiostoma lanceolatum TaxID=7740 RepID=UPI00345404FA